MKGTTGRRNWHRSALALLAVYALVLQTTLAALAAGLSAQPSPTFLHPLCAPGQTAPAEPASDGSARLPDCCASLCLSAAIALPPPAAAFEIARPEPQARIDSAPVDIPAALPAAQGYPLGARAPPSLA